MAARRGAADLHDARAFSARLLRLPVPLGTRARPCRVVQTHSHSMLGALPPRACVRACHRPLMPADLQRHQVSAADCARGRRRGDGAAAQAARVCRLLLGEQRTRVTLWWCAASWGVACTRLCSPCLLLTVRPCLSACARCLNTRTHAQPITPELTKAVFTQEAAGTITQGLAEDDYKAFREPLLLWLLRCCCCCCCCWLHVSVAASLPRPHMPPRRDTALAPTTLTTAATAAGGTCAHATSAAAGRGQPPGDQRPRAPRQAARAAGARVCRGRGGRLPAGRAGARLAAPGWLGGRGGRGRAGLPAPQDAHV
jgi:hypothetical protein